ncbi:hypothetical protein CRYO30217_01118 [Parvicella tangerina]|uniref:Uncharacterized protein n=1 Tax=Parvicella tangerina TaxID=2829795 RepID=A0A916JKV8_9FLAO|nr:hypothetical protein CRYO30217_01118 [Parvicella tangerina]
MLLVDKLINRELLTGYKNLERTIQHSSEILDEIQQVQNDLNETNIQRFDEF